SPERVPSPDRSPRPAPEGREASERVAAGGRATRGGALGPEALLRLQRTLGNRAVVQLLAGAAAAPAVRAPPPPAALPRGVRARMEAAFGTDLADVRVHAESPRATHLGALACTQGTQIHVAPGQWAPHTSHGQALLGHELTHVVQQRAGRVDLRAL